MHGNVGRHFFRLCKSYLFFSRNCSDLISIYFLYQSYELRYLVFKQFRSSLRAIQYYVRLLTAEVRTREINKTPK